MLSAIGRGTHESIYSLRVLVQGLIKTTADKFLDLISYSAALIIQHRTVM